MVVSLKFLRRFQRVEEVVQQRNGHWQALTELRAGHDQLVAERERLAVEHAEALGSNAALSQVIGQLSAQVADLAGANGRLEGERAALLQERDSAAEQARHATGELAELRQRLDDVRWLVKEQPDLNLLLDKRSLIDLHVSYHGRWEAEHIAVLRGYVDRVRHAGGSGIYFFDIGSCWGQYALVLKREVPELQVCAFEANVHNFTQLRANLMMNDMLGDVVTYNRCITDAEGTTTVFPPDPINKGAARVGERHAGQDAAAPGVEVDNLVLDHEFAHISDAFIIAKMDIEGSEPGALRGMRGLFERNRVVIQVEDWDYPHSETAKVLEELGLRLLTSMHPDHYFANFDIEELAAAGEAEAA